MTISNPRDLFLARLAEMLYVERRLADAVLPELRRAAADEELREALAEHLERTREHVERVETAFRAARAEPASRRSAALEALVTEHDELAGSVVLEPLRDAFHAAAALHGEHLELAGYEALVPLARALGLGDAADALDASREDEEQARERLRKIAERLVHAT